LTYTGETPYAEGGYTYQEFKESGEFTPPEGIDTGDALVVGGGAGSGYLGGAGAGGFKPLEGIALSAAMPVVVGVGGVGMADGQAAAAGGDSSFAGTTAHGGGPSGAAYTSGSNGASGGAGGVTDWRTGYQTGGGSGTAGEGNDGGTSSQYAGGSGGGAGAAGGGNGAYESAQKAGGDGVEWPEGSGHWYAGGGGNGAAYPGHGQGPGGAGGGGTGAWYDSNGTLWPATAGEDGTGGGAGGGFGGAGDYLSPKGGDGAVIVRWAGGGGGGASLATVTTDEVSSITSTAAQAGGDITDDGGATVTECGVCYGTATAPDTSGAKSASMDREGAFDVALVGLDPSTHYYVRAYAINSEGTAYGNEVEFDTAAGGGAGDPPTPWTGPIDHIGYDRARSTCAITSEGDASVTAKGLCWNTDGSPEVDDSHTTNGSGTGDFTAQMLGLEDSTTYHVRAYATNVYGTAYGDERTFETLDPGAPADDSGLTYCWPGFVQINGGAAYTFDRRVTLSLNADHCQPADPEHPGGRPMDPTFMAIATDEEPWSPWLPFQRTYPWLLPSATGVHTVYAKFQDGLFVTRVPGRGES